MVIDAQSKLPAIMSDAPIILDGLLMKGSNKKIKEQYADTPNFPWQLRFGQTMQVSTS